MNNTMAERETKNKSKSERQKERERRNSHAVKEPLQGIL